MNHTYLRSPTRSVNNWPCLGLSTIQSVNGDENALDVYGAALSPSLGSCVTQRHDADNGFDEISF